MLTMPGIEVGGYSAIAFDCDEVIKTTRHHYLTHDAALAVAHDLQQYRSNLVDEGLKVAPLTGVEVTQDQNGGFRLRHSYELIAGPSLLRLQPDEQLLALYSVLESVADMETAADGDTLRTPVDAKAQNFHGDVLVDIFPALMRSADGAFPTQALYGSSSRRREFFAPWGFGTKSGVITRMLFSTAITGETQLQKVGRALCNVKDLQSVIPANTPRAVERKVRRQIAMHFAPFIARKAIDASMARVG